MRMRVASYSHKQSHLLPRGNSSDQTLPSWECHGDSSHALVLLHEPQRCPTPQAGEWASQSVSLWQRGLLAAQASLRRKEVPRVDISYQKPHNCQMHQADQLVRWEQNACAQRLKVCMHLKMCESERDQSVQAFLQNHRMLGSEGASWAI